MERVIGIRAVDDLAEQNERAIVRQLVSLQNRFERAFLAVMAEFDVLDVIGNGVEPLGFVHHLVRRHEDEFRIFVDEVLDQPRAGDPIDFDAFPRNPFHCFLHPSPTAARSSAARSRQTHGVMFSIR
jgi:hypothetical protein